MRGVAAGRRGVGETGSDNLWFSQEPRRYRATVTLDDAYWWSVLRALDEPVPPGEGSGLESILRPVEGEPDKVYLDESMLEPVLLALRQRNARGESLEAPRDFDLAAIRARFDRLAERLSEIFGYPCESALTQDSACFGRIWIPADATRSRAKRTRIPLSLGVSVSSFGGLTTYGPSTSGGQKRYVHPDDRQRIEEALTGLGYLIVPQHILATPYDGPNGWAFTHEPDATWFTRFFEYL